MNKSKRNILDKQGIRIANGLLDNLEEEFAGLLKGRRVHLVSDPVVMGLWGKNILDAAEKTAVHVAHTLIPCGESQKSLENAGLLYEKFLQSDLTRRDVVIALGGGVVGDLAGFAAATYMRGVPVIQIPTTLLAQVDASVGGKTAVNLPQGKNLVGAFHLPIKVFIDTRLPQTLPDRLFAEGMAEVLKYGAIADAAFFEELAGLSRTELQNQMEKIILRCCSIKAEIVELDPKDNGQRMLLNFGHTLGHALEEAAGYGSYLHGEAVGLGMVAAALYGEGEGLTQKGTAERLVSVLKGYGLPVEWPRNYHIEHSLLKDKKRTGKQIDFILLRRLGEAFISTMPEEELLNLARRICK